MTTRRNRPPAAGAQSAQTTVGGTDLLRQNHEMYRLLFENASAPMYVHEATNEGLGRIIAVNEAACRLLGYTQAEFLNMDVTAIDVPEQAERRPAIMRKLFSTGRAHFLTEHLAKDGRRIPVAVVSSVIALNGTAVVLSIVDDLNERKRSQNVLLRRSILKTSRDIVLFIRSSDGAIVEANAAAVAAYGYSYDELLHLDIFRLRGGARAAQEPTIAAQMAAAAKSGILFEAEHFRKDGSVFPVEVSSSGMIDVDDGSPVLISVIRDISERKRSEEALRMSEAHLRAILEATDEAVVAVDNEWHITHVNRRFGELWQAPATILDATDGYALLTFVVNQLSEPEAMLAKAMAIIDAHTFDSGTVNLNDGRVFAYHTSPWAVADIDAGRVWSFRDISERKRSEEALRAREADLAANAERLKKTLAAVISTLGATTALRDPYTAGHEQRVAELAVAIAHDLGWTVGRIETLRQAALLHDVGKIVVPAEILTKPGKLSELEMQLVRLHPQAGADAIANIDFGAPLAEMVVQHHERLDGSGYPAGLAGGAILPEARVLAVADVVEAMISHRPYRAALPLAVVLAELEDGAGSRYDADVCRAALHLLREQQFTFSG